MWGYDNNVKRINKLAVLDRNIGDEVLVYNSMNGFLQDHVLDITFYQPLYLKVNVGLKIFIWIQQNILAMNSLENFAWFRRGYYIYSISTMYSTKAIQSSLDE